ncbi:MAG: PQQ-dependent sugar dehydrogenase [Planctomycetota bacterium]|nr:PQQ-dependent sugar dehydrogenase [Planctomycetota bacterium]
MMLPTMMVLLAAFIQDASPKASAPANSIPKIKTTRVWRDVELVRPVQLVARPDRADKAYVLEQAGRIIELDATDPSTGKGRVWLDIRESVNDRNNEEGLLSMAFHPNVAKNGEVYLFYTAEPPRREVLARFKLKADGIEIDPASREVLLEVADPAWNHNGGTVLFGPDGMLYLTLGDGGSGNDPWGNGQNLGVLLAKCLRIDVSKKEGNLAYAIPSDNPFVGREGARGEIWAYGLRNIWRMSFDRKTGELWGGDVGQNAYEEIDIIKKGGNYGWRPREGFHATNGVPDASESAEGFIEPIVEYPRKDGVSVTGGFVYRGSEFSDLQGVYLYADYAFGRIWGLRALDGKLVAPPKPLLQRQGNIASFGELNDGSLYICITRGGADGPGQILKIMQSTLAD